MLFLQRIKNIRILRSSPEINNTHVSKYNSLRDKHIFLRIKYILSAKLPIISVKCTLQMKLCKFIIVTTLNICFTSLCLLFVQKLVTKSYKLFRQLKDINNIKHISIILRLTNCKIKIMVEF